MPARQISSKKPKNLRYTLRTLFTYMGRHRFLLLAVGILVCISALANLLGNYMIRPVVNSLAYGNPERLIPGIMITTIVYFSGVAATFGYTQIMVKGAQKILFDIRRDLFSHLQTLPLSFFDRRRHGDIMSYFTNDIDTVSDALNNSFTMVIQSFIQMVGTLIILFILNWKLSLIVAVCYAAMFLYIKFSAGKSKAFYTKQQSGLGDLDGYIEEMVSGQKIIKVFNHERESIKNFRIKNEILRRAGTGAQAFSATMIPAVVSISYVNYAIVAILGGIMAMNNKTDIGSLASYLVFVRQAAAPINQFTQQSNFLLAALSGAERVFEAMSQTPEVDEGKIDLIKKTGANTEKQSWFWQKEDKTLVPLRGDVRFDNVDFGYDSKHMILKKISLYAKPGQKIAFVGPTGAGKTTITNLINRFYDVQAGQIIYDGFNVKDIKKDALRRSLGIVLQDTHLFTGTIAENIRFGKPDATDEEIYEAARIANADSFIRRLPQSYDTVITSDGANLSQGQRQLLSIARAAIADPPVLILDEATSSVDTRTEALIEKGMDRLMEGRTVFVIAHRLSTVRNADAIMVLEDGEITERGSHADLLAQRGLYWHLYHGTKELS